MKFIAARKALTLMKDGIELQAWYGLNGPHIFLMTPGRDRVKFPSLELMKREGWIREKPMEKDQNLSKHCYEITGVGRIAAR